MKAILHPYRENINEALDTIFSHFDILLREKDQEFQAKMYGALVTERVISQITHQLAYIREHVLEGECPSFDEFERGVTKRLQEGNHPCT